MKAALAAVVVWFAVCGTIACVLRTSEPSAVAFGEALSGGGIAAYATGRSHRAQAPRPFPLFVF